MLKLILGASHCHLHQIFDEHHHKFRLLTGWFLLNHKWKILDSEHDVLNHSQRVFLHEGCLDILIKIYQTFRHRHTQPHQKLIDFIRSLASNIEVNKILKFLRTINIVMIDSKDQINLNIKITQLLTLRVILIDNPTDKRKRHLLLYPMMLVKLECLLFVDSLEEVKKVLAIFWLFFVDLEISEDL